MIIDPAPAGFDPTPLDLSKLGTVSSDVASGEERDIVVLGHGDELHLRLRHDKDALRPALLVPIDGSAEIRLQVALRFVRALGGKRTKILPSNLRLTPLQKTRLVRLLHAFDIHEAGGGPREVASDVLASEQARLPSIEWKDSHARRAANRLIHDAIALVDRGYLKLLAGR